MSVSEYGKRLLAGIEANKLTIAEMEVIVQMVVASRWQTPIDMSILAKLRWHIAASRNELSDDYLLPKGKTT